MKNLLLAGVAVLAAHIAIAQTTIYSENFESGNSFTMNTSDLGAGTTYNTWLMNNTYAGGSGTFVCLGFPFSFTIPATPNQPGGITGSPTSNYMHIAAQAAVSSSILCASYIPADGTCVTNESNFARMTTPISTVGYTGVSFNFWWLCGGSANAFGQVYYSLDGGVTWILKQSNLNNSAVWTQLALTDAAWDNQVSLLFAFRFSNTTASTGTDPGFGVDQISVQGTAATNTITTSGGIVNNQWCQGTAQTIVVNFVSTGTYAAGNIYTAQISDASGSFAAPQSIGTLASTANGALSINAIAPISLAAGAGYRIRVIASNPSTIGTDNGADLTVNALPTVTQAPFTAVCENAGTIALVGGAPAGGVYAGTGVSGASFNPANAGVGTHTITYTYTDVNGCFNAASAPITVNAVPTVTLPSFGNICDNASPLTLSGGLPAGGVYSGPGVTGGAFDPSVTGAGIWTLTYTYTDANACTNTANATIIVDGCSSLDEINGARYQIYPNPASESVIVMSDIDFDAISLRDMHGKLLQSFGSNQPVDVSALSAGVYLIEIKYAGRRVIERLIVQ